MENAMPSLKVKVKGSEVHNAEAGVRGRPLLMAHDTLGDLRSFRAGNAPR
jgi:hypothetical protein